MTDALINNPLGVDPFIETFFSPDCNPLGVPGVGLGFSEVAQTFWSAGPVSSTGVYVPLGLASPVWKLTITEPASVPEPSGIILLGTELLVVEGLRRKQLSTRR